MATIHHHVDTVSADDEDLARKLKKSFYADDPLIGTETYNEGLAIYDQIQIHNEYRCHESL